MKTSYYIDSAEKMQLLGGKLAEELIKKNNLGKIVFLKGDLGAGKTTFTQGFLRYLGFTGNVTSPTYNLVTEYINITPKVYHFDLYRLNDPEELEFIGVRDYLAVKNSVSLIEWPEKGSGFLPKADYDINFVINDLARQVTVKCE